MKRVFQIMHFHNEDTSEYKNYMLTRDAFILIAECCFVCAARVSDPGAASTAAPVDSEKQVF